MANDVPETTNQEFEVKPNYNYSLSSEENYQSDDHTFYGKYKHERSVLDYTYHKHYSKERQLLQDQLIEQFLTTHVRDKNTNAICDTPLENWIVFTAGPMGAGKGHTISWLGAQDLFPLDAFVYVDPDKIRCLLPETPEYNRVDPQSSGYLTQKEVGYISEIMTYDSLKNGKNVLVDGSLRDALFYLEYFTDLRKKFPILKVAILNVTAKIETVLARAKKRALVTGRTVPEETILEALHKIPESLEILSPIADFVATFNNDDDSPEPILYMCSMQNRGCGSVTWKLFYEYDNSTDSMLAHATCLEQSKLKDSNGVVPMITMKEPVYQSSEDDSSRPFSPFSTTTSIFGSVSQISPPSTGRSRLSSTEGTIHGAITEGITSNRLSVRKSKKFTTKLRDLIKGVICSEDVCSSSEYSKDSTTVTSPQRSSTGISGTPLSPVVEKNIDDSISMSVSPQTLKSNSNDDLIIPSRYLYVDYSTTPNQMQCLPTWKDMFRDVWVMYCAPPSRLTPSAT